MVPPEDYAADLAAAATEARTAGLRPEQGTAGIAPLTPRHDPPGFIAEYRGAIQ
jgi:hypothetical protein